MRSKRVLFGLLGVVGLAIVIWVVGTWEEWGPELATDPAYRSGRASICKAPTPVGQELPSQVQDLGLQPQGRGFQRTRVYTFDAAQFTGGKIDVCSEYGFVKLVGINGPQGRVEITVRCPFPKGGQAVDDTQLATELRAVDGRLHIQVAQLTQGVTSFRSLTRSGARPANANVVVQVPRTGAYEVNVTANHHRMTIQNLDVRGVLEGYLSPGADIDAGLDGPLTVRVSGAGFKAQIPGAGNLQGGTTARLRPLRSGSVDLKADEGDVRLEVVGNDVGLEVTTNGSGGDAIRIGPTDAAHAESNNATARSAGFDRANVQIQVRASSAKGSVTVKRSPN